MINYSIGDILEIGAYWSVRVKDIPSFERYIAQLNTYYTDYRYINKNFIFSLI